MEAVVDAEGDPWWDDELRSPGRSGDVVRPGTGAERASCLVNVDNDVVSLSRVGDASFPAPPTLNTFANGDNASFSEPDAYFALLGLGKTCTLSGLCRLGGGNGGLDRPLVDPLVPDFVDVVG